MAGFSALAKALSRYLLTSSASQSPAPDHRVVCPVTVDFDTSTVLDTLDPIKRYRELSGFAASPTLKGPSGEPIIYGANDGGGGERFGVWDSKTGDRLLTLRIPNETFFNKDWESMAVGSCGSAGVDDTCIYIADVGDNTARATRGRVSNRNETTPYQIIKILEPNLDDFQDNDEIPISHFSVLPFNYFHPTSPTDYCDCEGMFIDQAGWGKGGARGDLYIVPKWDGPEAITNNRIFKIPSSVWPPSFNNSIAPMYSPEAVGTYPAGDLMGRSWTRAEATNDGTVIALGGYGRMVLFLRCPGATVAEVLAAGNDTKHCFDWPSPYSGQWETFAWMPDGKKNVQYPEGGSRPMGWTTMEYDMASTSQACPLVAYNVDGECRSSEDDILFPNAWCDVYLPPTASQTSSPTTPPVTTATPSTIQVTSPSAAPTSKPGSQSSSPPNSELNTPPPTSKTWQCTISKVAGAVAFATFAWLGLA